VPHDPVLTTVIGSYPLPGWLEFAAGHPEAFGADDREELARDAVAVAVGDQARAGLDVVTDGEQGRFDVKSYYVETPDDVSERIRDCLRYVPPERLAVAPDCGLSQTARWAAFAKLRNLVEGARRVRDSL
jgi:methionine synthase II (cobalamin-independent)